MKIIDPHLHLFNLSEGDYQWLLPSNPPFWPDKAAINKNFSEHDISLQAQLQLSGFIHIEAGFDNNRPWREIEWLEQHCTLPFRAIAATDLTLNDAEFSQQVNKLKKYLSVVGVRHILDESAYSLLTNQQVIANFKHLNSQGLNFEVQMPFVETNSVNALVEIIAKNQASKFIINHAGFPPIDHNSPEWQLWRANLATVAKFKNVAIKCSGWEMSDRNYKIDWLKNVIETCTEFFSMSNIMLASNFPLVLFSQQYQSYWQMLITQLPNDHQQAMLHDNAKCWYQLP